LIAATLDKVVTHEVSRLIIIAPPQHGKSTLASVHFPAYWFGRNPDSPIILTSYAASLAESKSRQARDLLESEDYKVLFPEIDTDKTSRSVTNWQIAHRRGELIAAGIGGPITGHGAALGIIDDPIENWEQAQSATVRDGTYEWYRTTFRTRIWEGAAIVIIMTRWHEDDLVGKLLAEKTGVWTILRLPAVAEDQEVRDAFNKDLELPEGEPDPLGRSPGEPLTPKRFSSEELVRLKRDVGSLAWNGEYQGRPKAPEGNRFKRTWFRIVDIAPKHLTLVRYWDKAATEGGGAYTSGVLMGRDERRNIYVLDVVAGQWSAGKREDMMKATAEKDGESYEGATVRIWVEQEPGSGGKESAEATVRNLSGFIIHIDRVTGSKEVRAEPFAVQAEAGNVHVLQRPWTHDYIEELAGFPNMRRKDKVDASSGAYNKLAKRSAHFG